MNTALPRHVNDLRDVVALASQARRVETPCGDGRMVWRIWGEASGHGAPLVLVHGGSGSWTHWVRNIAPLVAAGRVVYAPDLPGCGDSDPPPTGGDGDVLPEWIEAGANALFGDAACDVVAFSFGAMVSGLAAARDPQRVRRLVLVGAPALSTGKVTHIGLEPWTRVTDRAARDAILRRNLRRLMFARDASVDDFAFGLYVDSLLRDRLTGRRLAQTDLLARTLPAVACPVWGVWGAKDALYDGRRDVIAPALARAPAFRSLTFVPGAGHWVQFEDAPAFDAILADLLDLRSDPDARALISRRSSAAGR